MLNEKGGVEGDCTVTGLESGLGGVVDPIFKGKAFYIGSFIPLLLFYCMCIYYSILTFLI